MEVRGPDGKTRRLKQPWSVLAYQIAGDDGLKLLHADGKAEERESAAGREPADRAAGTARQGGARHPRPDRRSADVRPREGRPGPGLARPAGQLLPVPHPGRHQGGPVLHRGVAAGHRPGARATRSGGRFLGDCTTSSTASGRRASSRSSRRTWPRCCAGGSSRPSRSADREAFRQHVIAALKGIADVDEQTRQAGRGGRGAVPAELPVPPDLTEVLYAKWTQLRGFQRTRGVLRTFALALARGGEVGRQPAGRAGRASWPRQADEGLSEAARELVTVADTEEYEGRAQAWTGILTSELGQRPADPDGLGRPEAPRDRAGGRRDVPALAADRPERPDARS